MEVDFVHESDIPFIKVVERIPRRKVHGPVVDECSEMLEEQHCTVDMAMNLMEVEMVVPVVDDGDVDNCMDVDDSMVGDGMHMDVDDGLIDGNVGNATGLGCEVEPENVLRGNGRNTESQQNW